MAALPTSFASNSSQWTAAEANATNGAINQVCQSGTYASMPTFGQPGRTYICTDTGDEYLDTGSAWVLVSIGRGPVLAPPPTSGWSTTNLGTGTVTATTGTYLMTALATGGTTENVKFHYRTLSPTSGYTAVAYIDWHLQPWTNTAGFMLLSDGTKLIGWGVQNGSLIVMKLNSTTSFNAAAYTSSGNEGFGPYLGAKWWAIQDDGTNLYFMVSLNGVDWFTPYSMARTSFLTATQIGWGIDTNGSDVTISGRLRSLTGVT